MGDTMATLTVNFPLQLESVKFSNGNTAKRAQGYNTITFTSSVTISSVALTSGYLSWSGTLYWGKTSGAKTWKFATVSNGSVTILSHEQIDCTGDRTIYITAEAGSSASYKVKVVLGDGISQVGFGVNTASVSKLASTDFTVDVGSGGYVYITIGRYSENYSYPVTATPSSGSAWTVVNANGVYNDHYISAPSSPGTRTVTLTATEYKRYYYQIHVYGNGGTFAALSGAEDYTLATASSETVTFDFDLTALKTPSRPGYTFLGWGKTRGATTWYTDTISLTASSTSSGSPTYIGLYAIWTDVVYTANVKLGSGITAANVLVNGAQKAYITDQAYHAISISNGDTLTINAIAKQTGYGLPYLLTYYASATTTTPIRTAEYNTASVEFTWAAGNLWMVLSATKTSIDLFYWNSAAWDAANIKAGQPISNLTATRWNNLMSKIQELAEAEGGSYSYSRVSSGATIYASSFNAVRTAISNRAGYGTLPAAQSKGNNVKAALFEGSGSLKSALNAAINHYNNS